MILSPRRVLSAHYLLYFAGMGIILPYLNLYFDGIGLSGEQIGVISAVRSLTAGLIPLAWGALADRMRNRRTLFVAAACGNAFFFVFYLRFTTFEALLAVTLVNCIFYTPIIAFLEAFSMEVLGSRNREYGRLRAWGSASFIAMALVMGRVLEGRDMALVLPVLLCIGVLTALFSPLVPKGGSSEKPLSLKDGLGYFLRARVLVFQFCAFLMLVSHGAYYAFFSIHLEKLGFSREFMGLAWAVASLGEIVVMVFSARIFGSISPRRLLPLALAAAALRWGILAHASSAWGILGSQLLHAVTYAAFHVGCILYTEELIPVRARTLAQSVNNSVSYGLGMTAGFLMSGFLFNRLGGAGAFWASSVAALFGSFVFFAYNAFETGRKSS